MKKRITDLDNLDGAWPGGGAAINLRDPNGDRVMWDQIGSGTNWEDGLYMLLRRSDGTPYGVEQPSLVVFITDGQPTAVRTASGGSSEVGTNTARTPPIAIANELRGQGARTIGVMVGNTSTNSTYVGYLKDVVGPIEWNGGVRADGSINVGNAATADLFKGSFASLGPILRSILIAECGGTLDGAEAHRQRRFAREPLVGQVVVHARTSECVNSTATPPRRSPSTTRSPPVSPPRRSRSSRRRSPATCGTGQSARPAEPHRFAAERRWISRRHRHRPGRPGRVLSDDLEARMSGSASPVAPRPRDEGSVLPMILALMVVGSLAVVALLTFATTLFTNRPPIEVRDRTFWTAKSAMSMAMTLQREHGPDGCYQSTDSFAMNGYVANLTCTPTGNYFGTGRGRYAVITTTNNNSAGSFIGRGPGSDVKPVTGNVFVNAGGFGNPTTDLGVSTPGAGVVANVSLSNYQSTATPLARYFDPTPVVPPAVAAPADCNNPAVAPSVGFPNPGTAWSQACQPRPWWESAGDLNAGGTYVYPKLPPLPAYLRPSVPQATIGSCNVYYPGRYTAPLTLGAGRHYFPSGVYYFEGVLTLSPGAEVVAGQGRWDGCTFDAEAAFAPTAPNSHAITGRGATFLLGNAGRIVANNASFRINRRVSDSTSRGSETIAIRSVNFRTTPHAAPAPVEVPDDVVYLGEVYSSTNTACNASLSTTLCLQRAADHTVRATPSAPIERYRTSTLAPTDTIISITQTGGNASEQPVRDRWLRLRPELPGVADGRRQHRLSPACQRRVGGEFGRTGLRPDADERRQLVPRCPRRTHPASSRPVRLRDRAERSTHDLPGDHGGQRRRELCDQRLDGRPERRRSDAPADHHDDDVATDDDAAADDHEHDDAPPRRTTTTTLPPTTTTTPPPTTVPRNAGRATSQPWWLEPRLRPGGWDGGVTGTCRASAALPATAVPGDARLRVTDERVTRSSRPMSRFGLRPVSTPTTSPPGSPRRSPLNALQHQLHRGSDDGSG